MSPHKCMAHTENKLPSSLYKSQREFRLLALKRHSGQESCSVKDTAASSRPNRTKQSETVPSSTEQGQAGRVQQLARLCNARATPEADSSEAKRRWSLISF